MSHAVRVTDSDKNIFAEQGYIYDKLIGEGTYAKVYLVRYIKTNNSIIKKYLLACKVIDSGKSPKDFIIKFLPRELDILTKINHPYLIHLHSIYQRRKKLFIFMREIMKEVQQKTNVRRFKKRSRHGYLLPNTIRCIVCSLSNSGKTNIINQIEFAEKGDLLDHILINGEIKENKAKVWTHQLSLGLQYLHNLEIVHRDIKCENVLITINNNVKLADFGFSRFIADESGMRQLSSTYCGSLSYSAPEILIGRPYDPKCSDIWSLGVVLYVMLNQSMPFKTVDIKRLYELQMSRKWNFRSKIVAKLTEAVKLLVYRMLNPDASKRIKIDDLVNSSWFSSEDNLKVLSRRESDALESGIKNKPWMLQKTQKFCVPWRSNKNDEQICRMTSLRFEHSSDHLNLNVMSSKRYDEIKSTENTADNTADNTTENTADNTTENTADNTKIKSKVKIKSNNSTIEGSSDGPDTKPTENLLRTKKSEISSLTSRKTGSSDSVISLSLSIETQTDIPQKIAQSSNLPKASKTGSKKNQMPVQEETEEV